MTEKVTYDRTNESGEDENERFGEYGVVGAIQKDESDLDGRYYRNDDEHVNGEGEGDNDDVDVDDTRLSKRGQIPFSRKKLYGREEELEQLMGLFKIALQQSPIQNDYENGVDSENDDGSSSTRYCLDVTKAVFVSGFSGSGKSALVTHFVDNIRKSGRRLTGSKCHDQVLFLRAKYEKTQSPAPFSAYSTLFDQIPLSLTNEFRHVYKSLKKSLGDDVDVLRRIFPQLKHLFHGQTATSPPHHDEKSISSGQQSLEGHAKMFDPRQSRIVIKSRLKFAISALFRALCGHLDNRPLILYIDDLQWADQPGLELLQSLISDSTLQYLFFIGAYRSNEIDDNEHFRKMMNAIEGKVSYKTFHLNEISQQATGEFIADSLALSTEEVEPLTKAVFAKSLGNPLYTRQALEFLVRINALYYDNMIFVWSWNLCDGVDAKSNKTTSQYLKDLLTDDILEMVKSKIDHMPNQDLKRVVATASLVRSSFDVETLFEVMMAIERGSSRWQQEMPHVANEEDDEQRKSEKKKLVDLLDLAVAEGLLLRVPVPATRESSIKDDNPTFAFSHDRVQEAAASFVTKEYSEGLSFPISLGMGLLRCAQSERGEEWMYFSAARHLNSVPSKQICMIEDLCLEVVDLNLETAQLSYCLSAFDDAVKYVNYGLSTLSELESDPWVSHYSLALKLHCLGAQAELGAGNTSGAESHCETVFCRKRDMLSAMPAYKVHLDIMGGEGDLDGALSLILSVLEELGVNIPKSYWGKKIKAWMTLQRIRAGHIPTRERIQIMPFVSDPKATAIMELIQKALRFAFLLHPELYVLLCCEGIRWLNKYGLTETSGASTASFANVVTHQFGDFTTGVKLAELALYIIDRQNNKFNETQALNTANQNVLSWVRPLKSRLPYHVRAYECGVVSGNIEGACVGKWFTFWNLYHSSAPLAILEEDMRIMIKKVSKWGFMFFANLYSILLQLVQNLMGMSDNTTTFIGSVMNETEDLWKQMPHKAVLATFKSYANVVFGDFEDGAIDALQRGNWYTENMTGMQYGMEPFYRGISLYVMARKMGEKKYKTAARQVRQQYKVWVKKGCVNLIGLLKLLDAEDLALYGKNNAACKKYDDAIATLVNGGFFSNAGVACERYGMHLDEMGRKDGLRNKLEQAKSYYSRWGAKRKVEILKNQLENF